MRINTHKIRFELSKAPWGFIIGIIYQLLTGSFTALIIGLIIQLAYQIGAQQLINSDRIFPLIQKNTFIGRLVLITHLDQVWQKLITKNSTWSKYYLTLSHNHLFTKNSQNHVLFFSLSLQEKILYQLICHYQDAPNSITACPVFTKLLAHQPDLCLLMIFTQDHDKALKMFNAIQKTFNFETLCTFDDKYKNAHIKTAYKALEKTPSICEERPFKKILSFDLCPVLISNKTSPEIIKIITNNKNNLDLIIKNLSKLSENQIQKLITIIMNHAEDHSFIQDVCLAQGQLSVLPVLNGLTSKNIESSQSESSILVALHDQNPSDFNDALLHLFNTNRPKSLRLLSHLLESGTLLDIYVNSLKAHPDLCWEAINRSHEQAFDIEILFEHGELKQAMEVYLLSEKNKVLLNSMTNLKSSDMFSKQTQKAISQAKKQLEQQRATEIKELNKRFKSTQNTHTASSNNFSHQIVRKLKKLYPKTINFNDAIARLRQNIIQAQTQEQQDCSYLRTIVSSLKNFRDTKAQTLIKKGESALLCKSQDAPIKVQKAIRLSQQFLSTHKKPCQRTSTLSSITENMKSAALRFLDTKMKTEAYKKFNQLICFYCHMLDDKKSHAGLLEAIIRGLYECMRGYNINRYEEMKRAYNENKIDLEVIHQEIKKRGFNFDNNLVDQNTDFIFKLLMESNKNDVDNMICLGGTFNKLCEILKGTHPEFSQNIAVLNGEAINHMSMEIGKELPEKMAKSLSTKECLDLVGNYKQFTKKLSLEFISSMKDQLWTSYTKFQSQIQELSKGLFYLFTKKSAHDVFISAVYDYHIKPKNIESNKERYKQIGLTKQHLQLFEIEDEPNKIVEVNMDNFVKAR